MESPSQGEPPPHNTLPEMVGPWDTCLMSCVRSLMLISYRAAASLLRSTFCWAASKFYVTPNVMQVACCRQSVGTDS